MGTYRGLPTLDDEQAHECRPSDEPERSRLHDSLWYAEPGALDSRAHVRVVRFGRLNAQPRSATGNIWPAILLHTSYKPCLCCPPCPFLPQLVQERRHASRSGPGAAPGGANSEDSRSGGTARITANASRSSAAMMVGRRSPLSTSPPVQAVERNVIV